MDFSFPINVTKELLLSNYSEETYMEYYLGIPVKKGLVRNPLRNDHHPTASFYRNKSGELIFKDFGSNFYGNFISVVMQRYNCSYHEACEQIAKDFNIINSDCENLKPVQVSTTKFKYSGPTKIQITKQDFSKSELEWWKQYGITEAILNKYNVMSCKYVFLNGQLKVQSKEGFPIFGYFMGHKNNTELWRIYFPKRTEYRFMSNTSASLIQGFKQLPDKGKLLVITKSMKDVMCLRSLGIIAIAPNSENLFVSDELLEQLKTRFKHIVVFYDNDLPGISNMCNIKKKHPELLYFFIKRLYGAKDISDFYKLYGRDKTLTFIKDTIKHWLFSRAS